MFLVSYKYVKQKNKKFFKNPAEKKNNVDINSRNPARSTNRDIDIAEPSIITMIFDSSWWFSVKTTKENKKQNRIKIRRGTREIAMLSNVCHRIQCDSISAERFDI